MSNSAAYEWTYVDLEAERRRELRAQLAQETARSRNLRGQARSLRRAYGTAKVDVRILSVPGSADSAELALALESARSVNARAEAELARAAADVWAPSADKSARQEDKSGRTAPSRPATRPAAPTTAARAGEEHAARARDAAVTQAEALLSRDGASCEPEDLPVFARRLTALRQARTADEARTLFHDLGVLVHKSTQRQRDTARRTAVRARLLDRLEDASPEDRDHLSAAITEAPDPTHLEREVDLAVARAETARHRATVADTVMDALRERGYAVGDDFADLLTDEGSVVVPLGTAAGGADTETAASGNYGVRVALTPDRPGLNTVLVARTGAPAEADQQVQRWFCEDQLPGIEDAVRRQGVELARTATLPPGVRPTAVLPDGSWPDAESSPGQTAQDADETATADTSGTSDTSGTTTSPKPRPKKKRKPPRSGGYGQGQWRER
ncbi:hypothetical protein OKJ48_30625 [Streptomyces kunmingensis]|uniref:Uncharacterized protein n=1 Tax=Streptomyces kunmingensis TaxID=68225 RepID=A0ABU6CJZ1_9ACTN|nr:hypothetical protein [Streptomyces kunmingensis]MEB3964551.1 hypothetical protein [Streptomyces kunmingensis]